MRYFYIKYASEILYAGIKYINFGSITQITESQFTFENADNISQGIKNV